MILIQSTLIQKYDKKIISFFDPVPERETNWNFTGCQVPHFIIVLIPYINLLNLSWIKKNCLFFEEDGAFKKHFDSLSYFWINVDFINTKYVFIKPVLDKKTSSFEKYGAFKRHNVSFPK